jgi:hypothetical protein
MARRLWLHALSRIAEIRARGALLRAAKAVNAHTFFSAKMDGYVQRLKP